MSWLAIACSGGPDTVARMEHAERIGQLSLYLTLAVLVLAAIAACWRARRRRVLALPLLAIAHPWLVFGARRGDCGITVNDWAWPAFGIAVAAGALVVVMAERYRARHGR